MSLSKLLEILSECSSGQIINIHTQVSDICLSFSIIIIEHS